MRVILRSFSDVAVPACYALPAEPTLDPGENRLTESFAAVLERVPGLAAAFVSSFDIAPADAAWPLRVTTQRPTVGGKFVDLELEFGEPSAPELRVWVEVKHGADLHANQLENYLADLRAELHRETRLLVLAPRESMPSTPDSIPAALALPLSGSASRGDDPGWPGGEIVPLGRGHI